MAATHFQEMLKSNHWMEELKPSFAENAGQGATIYYSHKNKQKNTLTIAVFEKDKQIRFRVYDPKTKEQSWLQIEIDADVDKVVSKIIAQQDEITQEEAFGFYFSISGLGDVSILAWEQFEDDYR